MIFIRAEVFPEINWRNREVTSVVRQPRSCDRISFGGGKVYLFKS